MLSGFGLSLARGQGSRSIPTPFQLLAGTRDSTLRSERQRWMKQLTLLADRLPKALQLSDKYLRR